MQIQKFAIALLVPLILQGQLKHRQQEQKAIKKRINELQARKTETSNRIHSLLSLAATNQLLGSEFQTVLGELTVEKQALEQKVLAEKNRIGFAVRLASKIPAELTADHFRAAFQRIHVFPEYVHFCLADGTGFDLPRNKKGRRRIIPPLERNGMKGCGGRPWLSLDSGSGKRGRVVCQTETFGIRIA